MIEILYQGHHNAFADNATAAAKLIAVRVAQGHNAHDYQTTAPRPVKVRCNGNLVDTFDDHTAAQDFIDRQVKQLPTPLPAALLRGLSEEEVVRGWYVIES